MEKAGKGSHHGLRTVRPLPEENCKRYLRRFTVIGFKKLLLLLIVRISVLLLAKSITGKQQQKEKNQYFFNKE
ncbi:MAG: hypothetical protein ACO1NX_11045 [Chitinophagaceae bacterium]